MCMWVVERNCLLDLFLCKAVIIMFGICTDVHKVERKVYMYINVYLIACI